MALSPKVAPVGLLIASALFAVAAAVPAVKGEPSNPAFLILAIVFALLGGIALGRSRGKG